MSYLLLALYLIALLLVIFSSLEWFFKVLLSLLIGLEYWRQKITFKNKNHLSDLEVRNSKLFIKRQNEDKYQLVTDIKRRQNRIFAELELHLKDETQTEFICQDRFTSRTQYSLFMQNLRFSQ